jgi:hypothetical protein
MKKILVWLFISLISSFCALVSAQEPDWKLIESEYPTTDIGVSTYIVTEHGADNTGVANAQLIFQSLLSKLGREGGGVLFVPKGKYKIDGYLVIPKPDKPEPKKKILIFALWNSSSTNTATG